MNAMKNPIIPGYYPDPTICCAGDDYYLACSSFEMCPGLPVFHSRDLAHWEQIANAITKENGLHMEKNCGVGGLMAPTLRYHAKRKKFYIINANFSDKGNYIIEADDPKGPWSMPHWLDDVPGIDASLFFDDDGKAYVMGTGDVWEGGNGVMERGIWAAEYDIDNFKMIGEPKAIFNTALRVAASPEAPHLYHIGDYYYLMIAEGGTEHYHSVVVARSRELFGKYEGNPANPVMTHRHMGFRCPITNVGHADWVELPDGSWYAVMLGSRLIDGECKNLGRETFICPVEWECGWPLFSPRTGKVEWEYPAPPCLPWTEYPETPALDDFDGDRLSLEWTAWGTPYEDFYSLEDSKLRIRCIRQPMVEELRPTDFGSNGAKTHYAAVLTRRQRKIDTAVSCQMHFLPKDDEGAGLAVIQAMNHQLHVERACAEGRQVLRAVCYTADYPCPPYFPGFESVTNREVVAEAEWDSEDVVLRIEMKGEDFCVQYGAGSRELKELCRFDGRRINPEKVGCMAGTLIGLYASGNGKDSRNVAEFAWFEMK